MGIPIQMLLFFWTARYELLSLILLNTHAQNTDKQYRIKTEYGSFAVFNLPSYIATLH